MPTKSIKEKINNEPKNNFTRLSKSVWVEPDNEWETKFDKMWIKEIGLGGTSAEQITSPFIIDKIKSFIQNLLSKQQEELRQAIENLKWKCDGENGCGYDGSKEDKQYLCGGPVSAKGLQLHQIIRVRNLALDEILNLLN